MKRISFFLLAILFITLIHPPIVIALELAEISETTTDESEASPTAENAEVGSTEDTLTRNKTNQSETSEVLNEPIKPFNDYETDTIWSDYRNDSRFSIDLVKVTHHSIDANYRVKHEGPNVGPRLQINLQYGVVLPSMFGDPYLFQTQLGSGDFLRNHVMTGVSPGAMIFLTLSTLRFDNEGLAYLAGARQLVITAAKPSISSTELIEVASNKATISQRINVARNNSDYRPVMFEVKVTNQRTGAVQTQSYTDGLELFSETASQFTTHFELPDLAANTEYSVSTRLTTGDSFSTANQITSDWTTPFLLTTNQQSVAEVEVIAKPADIILGTPAGTIDPKSLVEVKSDGVTVPASEYTCVLSNSASIETRTIGNPTAQVRVTYKGQPRTISVPLTVKWGSTIQHNGTFQTASMKDQERIIGTYTWHQGFGIRYSPFTLSAMNQFLISEASTSSSSELTSFSVFSGRQDIRLDSTNAATSFKAMGSNLPHNLQSNYDSMYPSGYIPAEVGDVVESRHIYKNHETLSHTAISNRVWQGLRTDDVFTDPTGGLNNTYYEITANGFHPLVVNQAIGVDAELEPGTTRMQLDARINDFVELPQGVQAVGFDTYPNLEDTGTSTGKIRVEETLQSGKKIQSLVSVNFELLSSVEFSAKPTDILLGTPVGMIDPKSLVEVKNNGATVPASEYTSEILNPASIETRTVGNPTAQVRVTYNEQTETISVPLTVKWGSSIQHNGTYDNAAMKDQERIIGTYTWHPGLGIRYSPFTLTAMGQFILRDISINNATTITSLSVFSGGQDIKLGSTNAATTFESIAIQTPSIIQSNYNSTYGNGFIPAEIGDVVRSYHILKNNEILTGNEAISNRIWQGLRTDDGFTDSTGGLINAYYEITAEGFSPLVVNQARGIDTELEAGTTREQLDARINDFVDLPQGVQAIRFETYPNLDSGGISTGQILVEETLQSGRKIQCLIPVDFDVTPVMISVKLPVSMLFHTDNVKGANVPITSQSYRIQNDSNIPVGIRRTNVANARNYSNIHKLNFTSTDVQGSAWENIITNGVLSPSDSQQVRLEVGQTTTWSFSGTATATEEINPYLEMVFTVSAIN